MAGQAKKESPAVPVLPKIQTAHKNLLFVFLLRYTHESRADALYCLLTQAKPSIVLSYTHESRADALYCLLTQAIRSLMARKKQMSASQPLVFSFAHYTLYSGFPR